MKWVYIFIVLFHSMVAFAVGGLIHDIQKNIKYLVDELKKHKQQGKQ